MNPDSVIDRVGSTKISFSVGEYENREAIADRMETLAIELRALSDRDREPAPSEHGLMALAAKIYGARRRVDNIFGMEGFAVSPAWDMMLDLYQARVRGKQISVTSACIGGACPATTGLRWLQALESMNLIARQADPDDRRRFVVALTDAGRIKVESAIVSHL